MMEILFFLSLFFEQLKKNLQILTLGIGSVGLVSTYVSYSPEIAARYTNVGNSMTLSMKIWFLCLIDWLLTIASEIDLFLFACSLFVSFLI